MCVLVWCVGDRVMVVMVDGAVGVGQAVHEARKVAAVG